MRIEEVTKTKLSKACDKELLILKLRFTQLWDKNFKDTTVDVVGSLNRNSFLKNYRLLLTEMATHKIEKSTSAIDRAVFKKVMIASKYGLDVSDFEDIIVVPDYVISDVPVLDIEKLVTVIKGQHNDLVDLIGTTAQPSNAYIPVYDLVLKAKTDTVIVEISKPYPNEHSARLQDPEKFETKSYRRTKGGLLNGSKKVPTTISIIWGKLKEKAKVTDPPLIAQALRFPKKDWTVAKAKKWLTDNEVKFIEFEAAIKATKKLLNKTPETEQTEVQKFEKFVSVYQIDKTDKEEHIVCGIVYEPDTEDAQGDMASEIEIRKAAYQFMEDVQVFKVMHKGKKVKVKMLESYIAPADFTIASQSVKKGTWVITLRVLDKAIWKAIKDGKLTGFSMAGYAKTS